MKRVLYKVLLFFKNFFLSLSIHLHVGSNVSDDSEDNEQESATKEGQ